MRLSLTQQPFVLCLLSTLLVPAFFPSFAQAQVVDDSEVKVKHILLGSQEEAETVRKEIVAAGGTRAAFTKAARKHSKDATTRILGGDLGWITKKSGFDEVFTQSAFDAKEGEVTAPVKTPFGFHLLYVVSRRDMDLKKLPLPLRNQREKQRKERDAEAATTAKPPQGSAPKAKADVAALVPEGATGDAAADAVVSSSVPAANAETTAQSVAEVATAAPEKPKVVRRRRSLPEKRLRITLETVASTQPGAPKHFLYGPSQAAEVNITAKNESSTAQKFFAPRLLALGLSLKPVGSFKSEDGDFSSLQAPESFAASLETYESVGFEVNLNEYFSGAEAGRYLLSWNPATFFQRLESTFPQAKDDADYSAAKAAWTGPQQSRNIQTDVIIRDRAKHMQYTRREGMDVSFFETIRPNGKYYARLKLQGQTDPILIRLLPNKQFPAVNHFATLVLEGFYDGLDFFEIKAGEYFLGGDPASDGTGAPDQTLLTRNNAKISHKRGTVSLVSRSVRGQGPVRGGQVGSIFFVGLKDHPEWDEEHVPVGEVISGLEVLEKQSSKSRLRFSEFTILTEEQVQASEHADLVGAPEAAVQSEPAAGNPEVLVKTSKGDLRVELFQDTALNTVGSFLDLTGKKFFEGQKFFYLMKDETGVSRAIQAGSPTNDFEGGIDYSIPDEVDESRKHVKGALVMVKQYDPDAKQYVPDTAGSQFIICITDIPSYDSLGAFTVFGQVRDGLDVLDKLAEQDTIESVTVTKKGKSGAFRKVGG